MAEIHRLREGVPRGWSSRRARFVSDCPCGREWGARSLRAVVRRARSVSDCRNASSWAEVARPRAHELHFVEHPLRVLVQEGELHRPERARRGVAAHQCTAQQHVLRADEHGWTLRVVEPAASVLAAHEDVHVFRPRELVLAVRFGRQLAEPVTRRFRGLLDERPHRQAPDQPPRRGAGAPQAVCGPPERHRGGLARACRRDQDLWPSFDGQRELPRVGLHVRAEHDSIDGGAVHGDISWRKRCDEAAGSYPTG